MGGEQADMQALMDIANGKATTPIAMPEHGYGGGTPNQKRLKTARGHRQKEQTWPRERPLQFVTEEEQVGHCKIGDSPTEVSSTTHNQLHQGGASGLLLQADINGDDELFDKYLRWYRLEYAYSAACIVVLNGKEQVVTGGPRAFDQDGKPVLFNSLRTKMTLALRDGWKKTPNIGEGAYDVAIEHMRQLLERGSIKPKDITDGASYEVLTKRYGFNVARLNGGGIYQWFTALDSNALEPIYGVGVTRGGKPLVCKTLEQALNVAEKVQRLGRLTA